MFQIVVLLNQTAASAEQEAPGRETSAPPQELQSITEENAGNTENAGSVENTGTIETAETKNGSIWEEVNGSVTNTTNKRNEGDI